MKIALCLLLVGSVMVTGCQKKGPMERAGERVDEIGDNISEGENPLRKKGPIEKAGEAIDDAVNNDSR